MNERVNFYNSQPAKHKSIRLRQIVQVGSIYSTFPKAVRFGSVQFSAESTIISVIHK